METVPIADIILQHQNTNEMLRRSLETNIQLYTDRAHFIYELLQNAEDAGATKIKFDQFADRIEVLHDGKPFSSRDLYFLCNIALSEKKNNLNQIGKFGVGFKSVFGICETVQLYSHPSEADMEEGYKPYAEEIRDFTHPVDIVDQDIEPEYTTKFVFPYSVNQTFSSFKTIEDLNKVLSKRLQDLGITTLLFMKNLQSIDYEIDLPTIKLAGSYRLDKTMINDHCSLVSAIGEKGITEKVEEVSYLVFSRIVEGMQIGKTIDIAYAVTLEESGEYNFKPVKEPYISVYFPTETESKLKFIVQGPYRTTPDRSGVPADDDENIELAKQSTALLRDSILELRDLGKLNFSFLNILPMDIEVFGNASLFECMVPAIEEMMTEEKIILCKDGTYATADSVKIARGSEFAEILSSELLTELLNTGKEYHWAPTFLTETNRPFATLYWFLTSVLYVEVIRPDDLKDAINNNKKFLSKRDDEWLIKFYNMYGSIRGAFDKNKRASNMLTAEMIKTSKGTFVAPYRRSDKNSDSSFFQRGYENASYLPNVFLPVQNMDEMEDINFVDEKILPQCEHFFKEILNLKKPDEYEFFIHNFKRRSENGEKTSEEQHIKDIKKLLYYLDDINCQEEVYGYILKFLKLKCIKDGKEIYINPGEQKVYLPINFENMRIKEYFLHIVSYPYVDMEFYENNNVDAEMLTLLGVAEDVSIGLDLTNGEFHTGNPGRQPEWTTYGDFRWKLNLDHIDEVLEYISNHPKSTNAMEKSSFIFQFLKGHADMLVGTVYIGGNYPNISDTVSEIIEKLRKEDERSQFFISGWDGKWLFTKAGELVSQKEISKQDLLPELYGDVSQESKLCEILGFAQSKAEQLELIEKDYDQLDDDTKDQFFEIELQRRLGMSYIELKENLPSFVTTSLPSFECAQQDSYRFPSAKVKNWDSLRKHVAEVLSYANPVKYQLKVRRLRVSRPSREIDAYLRSMYKVESTNNYACQMCHKPVESFEQCQIYSGMDKELVAMFFCMCPTCATKYRKLILDDDKLQEFLENILKLDIQDINSNDPVKIDFADESIWFTQTHIAEIKELMCLRNEVECYVDSPFIPPKQDSDAKGNNVKQIEEELNNDDLEAEVVVDATEVYKEYVGKRVFHETVGAYGIVKACDEKYISIEFDQGSKTGEKITKYSLEKCLSNDWIKIIE